MTTDELAEQLYNLIVIEGRWNGKPPEGVFGTGSYRELEEFVKIMWREKALEFASENTFRLTDAPK